MWSSSLSTESVSAAAALLSEFVPSDEDGGVGDLRPFLPRFFLGSASAEDISPCGGVEDGFCVFPLGDILDSVSCCFGFLSDFRDPCEEVTVAVVTSLGSVAACIVF